MDSTILASILILGFGVLIALAHGGEYIYKHLKKTEISSKVLDTVATLRVNIWGILLFVTAAVLWRVYYTNISGKTFESLLLEILIIFGTTTVLVLDRLSLFVVTYHEAKGSPPDIQKVAVVFRYKVWCITATALAMVAYTAFTMK